MTAHLHARARVRRSILLVVMLCGSASLPQGVAAAATSDGDPVALRAGGPDDARKHPKLDSHVAAVAGAARERGVASALDVARSRTFRVAGESVRVIVSATTASAARDAVRASGGRVESEYASLVQAFVPAANLLALAALPSVRRVGAPDRPVTDAIVDEGVSATNASAWQTAGWTGAGVKVAVIDAGFLGYVDAQREGDLPAVTAMDFGCGGVATNTAHGTAVAEVVHKMAPQAQLYLICAATQVNLGEAKDYAVAQGVSVINHSVSWFNTSRGDGRGPSASPDGIVASARASGVLWVNAAGNRADRHWSGAFSDPGGDGSHDFAGGSNTVTVMDRETLSVFLKWDSWPTTSQDFDLDLMHGGRLVSTSDNLQNGTQPPTEQLSYTNTSGAAQTLGIVIRRQSLSSTSRLDLFAVGGGSLAVSVGAGSITEPASSPNALAAGAVCWLNDLPRPYSGRGPTIDGRTKPDLTGQDGTTSPVFGGASGCESGFIGTSASAPRVAGAAALVKQANPTVTHAQLQAFLEARARDAGAVGKDNQFGAGVLALGAAPIVAPAQASPAATPGSNVTPRPGATAPVSATPAPATGVAPARCTATTGPGLPPPAGPATGLRGYHAAWYGQSGYPTLCPGQRSTSTLAMYNTGHLGWALGQRGATAYLGTWSPDPGQDRPSQLGGDGTQGSANTEWPRYNRVAVQPVAYVGPGQVAWFQFTIQAPTVPGRYRLFIRAVVEDAQWLEDYGIFWPVTVLRADGTMP